MDELIKDLEELHLKYSKRMLPEEIGGCIIDHIRSPKDREDLKKKIHPAKEKQLNIRWLLMASIPVTLSIICAVLAYVYHIDKAYINEHTVGKLLRNIGPCLLENNMFIREITRPGFNCSVCANLTSVPVVTNISRREFAERYAFTGLPVVVKDATQNWSAVGQFNLTYFKSIYTAHALQTTRERCQFFAYNTEFSSLEEALNMGEERASYTDGQPPWYFGWSACDPGVRAELRRHYERPAFLPEDSEAGASADWVFMGGPGHGAHWHIDHVGQPSWQAQLSGTKTWLLRAPPECEAVCLAPPSGALEAKLEPGDVLVVDTDRWFHATVVQEGGGVSVALGSEFN